MTDEEKVTLAFKCILNETIRSKNYKLDALFVSGIKSQNPKEITYQEAVEIACEYLNSKGVIKDASN